MSIDYNKAAFPLIERGGNGLELTDAGMTLRDYFAAKAMGAMVDGLPGAYEIAETVKRAYAMADAMLKARETK